MAETQRPYGEVMDELDHAARLAQEEPWASAEKLRSEELRIHALGAAISRREWSEVERAHAAIRDEFHARQRTARALAKDHPNGQG